MAEKKTTIQKDEPILSDTNVKKEFNAIKRMFRSVKDDDPDKMKSRSRRSL